MSGIIHIISDLHFGHINMAIKRGFKSVQEHDEYIIECWNNVVKKRDTIWILGDVTMEKRSNYYILDRLKGIKKVVMGNHDKPNHVRELLNHVNSVAGMVKFTRGVVLSHCPLHPIEVERYGLNIHGHVHENTINDPRYINVSAEVINYTPINLKELIEKGKL